MDIHTVCSYLQAVCYTTARNRTNRSNSTGNSTNLFTIFGLCVFSNAFKVRGSCVCIGFGIGIGIGIGVCVWVWVCSLRIVHVYVRMHVDEWWAHNEIRE